jgi:thiol-disulfide isomerase/thioredoxin
MRPFGCLLLLLLSCSTSSSQPAKPKGHVQFINAPAQPEAVQALVKQKSAESKAKGRTLVVYAGASWCEPCKRFHEAADQGKLDAEFGDLDFLAFDVDFDNERLAYGNYETSTIPVLAMPREDGNASDKYMSGSIKGDGAVNEMTPRLKKMLGR